MNTLAAIRPALTVVLMGVGAWFFLVGTIGLLRLPDFYARTHAATKCDTVGAGALLLGIAVYMGVGVTALKILILLALVMVSSPTCGHALARAAWRTGHLPWHSEPGGGTP